MGLFGIKDGRLPRLSHAWWCWKCEPKSRDAVSRSVFSHLGNEMKPTKPTKKTGSTDGQPRPGRRARTAAREGETRPGAPPEMHLSMLYYTQSRR